MDRFVEAGDCELTGVAEMQDAWVMEGHEVSQKRVIMLGVAHDYDEISQAPETAAGLEVMAQYGRAAAAAKTVAGWLREQGWDADADHRADVRGAVDDPASDCLRLWRAG